MGRNSAEHRRQCPPRLPPRRHAPQDMASLPIPDELLAEIFVRLPTPTDLVRASAACVSFRRVVADRSFLRQFRKLHAPPLLGFLSPHTGFHPAEPPYPSASAASAVALAADFSFSFLPAPDPAHRWVVWDIRDGRVLLRGMPLENFHGVIFTEMVVCDPLHRRYLMLPSIPDDLAATVEGLRLHSCEIFLVPKGGDEDDESTTAEETSFKVIWMGHCEDKLITYVFSSSTRQWQAIRSLTWTNLSAGLLSLTETTLFCRRQYAYGCFYWLPNSKYKIKMLVLNTRKMEFSIAEPPTEPKVCYRRITMVEAGEGRPGVVVLTYGTRGHIYTIWRNNNESSSQWQKDKVIPPSPGSGYVLRHSMGTHLLLSHWRCSSFHEDLCTLDMKTLQIERVCASTVQSFAYSNYPPSLSSPTISNDGY